MLEVIVKKDSTLSNRTKKHTATTLIVCGVLVCGGVALYSMHDNKQVVSEDGGIQVLNDGTTSYDFSGLPTYTGYAGLEVIDRGGDNLNLYYNESTGSYTTYAQELAKPFTEGESQCSLEPLNEVDLTGEKQKWSIPALGDNAWSYYTATNPVELPSQPVGNTRNGAYGAWYSGTAKLFDSQGAGVYLGHVNYGAGVLSVVGGDKSPYGELHRIEPCMHKYITDGNGDQREFVAVSAQQFTPEDVESNEEYRRLAGERAIYDITCAGPLGFGDDGQGTGSNSLLGSYPYRIVVKYVPVSGD